VAQRAADRQQILDEVEDLKASLRDSNQAKALAEAKVEQTRVKIAALTDEASNFEQAIARLERDAASLSVERDDSRRELEQARTALTAIQQEVAELSAARGGAVWLPSLSRAISNLLIKKQH